jgi:hypothetical protein
MYGLELTDDGFDHLWSREICSGGIYWTGVVHGISNDGKNIFAPCSQSRFLRGGWYSLDPLTGNTNWVTPVDAHWGPISSAGELMFGGSWAGFGDSAPEFTVLNSRTGEKVFTYLNEDPQGGSPRSVMCAPSIVDGWVYWGSGYKGFVSLSLTHFPSCFLSILFPFCPLSCSLFSFLPSHLVSFLPAFLPPFCLSSYLPSCFLFLAFKDAQGTAYVYAFALPEEMEKRGLKKRITPYPGPPELKGLAADQYAIINRRSLRVGEEDSSPW